MEQDCREGILTIGGPTCPQSYLLSALALFKGKIDLLQFKQLECAHSFSHAFQMLSAPTTRYDVQHPSMTCFFASAKLPL
eukprot:1150323-Pelagomonas_calceolata.AAC.2